MLNYLRKLRFEAGLPQRAKAQKRIDAAGLPAHDPGIEAVVSAGLAWLYRAQDCSTSADGGVARDFSLIDGWASSYPETTGYIVPTLIECGQARGEDEALRRARRMLDWFVDIQMPGGGFQGGKIDSEPVVAVTFNTGQILLGLAAGQRAFGGYAEAMRAAADWLVETQDADGCWRRFPTPFAAPGEKAYETHVAWSLFEADRVEPGRGWASTGLKQVDWALQWQHPNGWFERCCLVEPQHPLTHTLGYVLRGIVEAYRISDRPVYLEAARRTADSVVAIVDDDGYLPGRLDRDWRASVRWVCLTGTVQLAHCLLLLYQATGHVAYLDTARRMNRYVRRSVALDGPEDTRGAVRGSFPIDGDYGQYEYLNWAVKFAIDANVLEAQIAAPQPAPST